MNSTPTQAQLRVLCFIQEFQARKGYPPTAQEIAEAFGRDFRGSVGYHLSRMQALGFLAPRANCRQLWQILVELPGTVLPEPLEPEHAAPAARPSPEQLSILYFIRDFQERHGFPPTVRDIAGARAGWSVGGMSQQLNRMVGLGLLAPRANCRQRWQILVTLPEMGS